MSSDDSTTMITITLAHPSSGKSDSIPISAETTTLGELMEWSKALLGLTNDTNLVFMKDGKPLASTTTTTTTVKQAGIRNGDLLAVVPARQQQRRAPPPAAASGGLDFFNLLGGGTAAAAAASGSAGGLNFSNLLAGGAPPTVVPDPIFYQGMNLEEAVVANPHPEQFVTLLFQQDLLWKELNYYQPRVAQQLHIHRTNLDIKKAADVWRQQVVKNGIQNAVKHTQKQQKQQEMKKRLEQNPNDATAKSYFEQQENQQLIQQQYFQMLQEFPESMGRVLMLYINAKVNGVPIQTFVDSGAQTTIMSFECAQQCKIAHLIDDRFSGIAVGVGTGKIMGRVHLVGLEITDIKSGQSYHFPCTITVMEALGTVEEEQQLAAATAGAPKRQMDFLLGLDMLKRHNCLLDLKESQLKFQLDVSKYLCTPFLHEKDLDVSKGGTKGFDAKKANELMMLERLQQEQEHFKEEDDDKEVKDDAN